MSEITIKILNAKELAASLRKAPAIASREIQLSLEKIIYKVQRDTMREAPVNKQSGGGNLRQSIEARMESRGRGVISVGVSYAAAVHDGTAPHEIVAHGRTLYNHRTGQFFGKRVQHPGTTANPFLQRALDQNNTYIGNELDNCLEKIIKQI